MLLRPFIATKKIPKLHLIVHCFVVYCDFYIPFELQNAFLKRRDFGSYSRYWKDNIEMYFEKIVLECGDSIFLFCL